MTLVLERSLSCVGNVYLFNMSLYVRVKRDKSHAT